ncbi:hypothetical protein ASG12_01970 [Williamsia sp. Leaf354]|uniref:hemolysin family protein n=1 Tax=Williamsia sp. Leaf354 TaxID=1736349 RepID=UPI0006F28870|nr:hemolysin family protein [Williamsia sp. Leaf354]KQR99597.1 hypothetical protein ASG12_01970 [Williamsia sp. Leaf354]
MSNPWVLVAVTVGLIAASAFFVAIEFALIAARRHRLEDAAVDSRAARAALRSASDLSVLLAGSQLGITVCTLALGAVTKPAVHYWLTPQFESLGAPLWIADVIGFVLALIIVTFLHLVVGEMAPKSWAIAHPERSATLLAIPMRGFMWFTRPLLVALNSAANWCLRRVGVEPVDQTDGTQDTDGLRHLVEHSGTVGTLDERYHGRLISALEIERLTVGDIVGESVPATVDVGSPISEIRSTAHTTGHLRLLVWAAGKIVGVVHVRDGLTAPKGSTAGDIMRSPLWVDAAEPVHQVLRTMRESRTHLAIVRSSEGDAVRGIVTLTDVVDRLLPATPVA